MKRVAGPGDRESPGNSGQALRVDRKLLSVTFRVPSLLTASRWARGPARRARLPPPVRRSLAVCGLYPDTRPSNRGRWGAQGGDRGERNK